MDPQPGPLHLYGERSDVPPPLADDLLVTIHLDSGTEVVILEGRFVGHRTDDEILEEYNAKYGGTTRSPTTAI